MPKPLKMTAAEATPKMSKMKYKKLPKLGGGKRFAQLTSKLASRGAKNPKALAAAIGRKKYGGKKMASLAAAGRRRASK